MMFSGDRVSREPEPDRRDARRRPLGGPAVGRKPGLLRHDVEEPTNCPFLKRIKERIPFDILRTRRPGCPGINPLARCRDNREMHCEGKEYEELRQLKRAHRVYCTRASFRLIDAPGAESRQI